MFQDVSGRLEATSMIYLQKEPVTVSCFQVVFKLHETFRDPVVEVTTAPFELKRFGWGTFMVKVVIHLQDGRQVETSHMLCFDKPETFRTVLLPLRSPEATGRSESFWGLCGKSSADQGSEFTVETREFMVETREAVVRSTSLFTDGHANMGITKTEDLCQAATGLLGELKEYKSSISTFGFGADHNADMLRCLADTTTDGTYSHVESEDQIAEAFGEALGGQNLKRPHILDTSFSKDLSVPSIPNVCC